MSVVSSARVEAAMVEMEYLERENEARRLKMQKEFELAQAEEKTLKTFMAKGHAKQEVKQQVKEEVKREPAYTASGWKPPVPDQQSLYSAYFPGYFPPFLPPETNLNRDSDFKLAIQALMNSQAKQTGLNTLLTNQQRTSHVPIKEHPVSSVDPFVCPAFVTMFDSIIEANVSTQSDRLFFLDKYTSGKANVVIKGFLATNSETAYQEARNLQDSRYGNPIKVGETFKRNLREWPEIADSDSAPIQQFSDFHIRCEEAMKSLSSMADLDSPQTLLQASAKLPSYSGVKWCRQAHETQYQGKSV
ncbi:LOW QUALITY PROTEIN: uncharacterized protein LOC5510887 [Nematostella vectensis]|uniref:LOW QUALITY PROTEIN: uncharacterized protein LOC5510887 n=1 Tax=Nematostella vectensis TaxID=45351 RepID=UPI0020775C94|nr:LOW QUALITY PROTEIN: uncharacterized protein LOC5510887 [Nematostella vectensis]